MYKEKWMRLFLRDYDEIASKKIKALGEMSLLLCFLCFLCFMTLCFNVALLVSFLFPCRLLYFGNILHLSFIGRFVSKALVY